MNISRVRIRRIALGEDAGAWARAIEDPSWHSGARVLKNEPGSSWVRRATVNGRDVVVKCRMLRSPARRMKAALGLGHGDKHWRGASALASEGIPTARPLAHAHAMVDGGASDVLVLEYLDGPSLLELLDRARRGIGPTVRMQHAIAEAAGRLIITLLDASLENRDHKPSNLIVLGLETLMPRIAVIDCVAIRRLPKNGVDWGETEEMAAQLLIEPRGCGCSPRRALWMRAARVMFKPELTRYDRHVAMREWFWLVRSEARSDRDPRPKVNPLPPR